MAMTRPVAMTAQATAPLTVLGIETSCDDTAAAVLRVGDGVEILSSKVTSQVAEHADFGGVVPEIAARAHAVRLPDLAAAALAEAGVAPGALDLIAATAGPGLIGGVMSGFTFAKGLSLSAGVPLMPVNHLAGHALSVELSGHVPFPYLLLLVSGGHTQLLVVEDAVTFRRLGTTIDDAAGEAFDKTAKLLGLDGAGGPAIEKLAVNGDAARYDMPRPLLGRPGCDFSFSGMKTAIRQHVEEADIARDAADIAASFQAAAVAHLISRTARAMEMAGEARHLVAAGGVAANTLLRAELEALAAGEGWQLVVPPLKFCTDNAAMIALAGARQYLHLGPEAMGDVMRLAPRARWPLDEREADVTLGSGRKGRKA
ncbi:tRNA (adenosine(37)-N6)-threonylcarbamoyltransferase complex transferase subunit TsaD [Parvularcula marina]|uniref:tRNA (adenosine(37)-N6)-threonylcarbamoyltransferase complex transferase subunit TsaD n=2 Tax=Parvularcula marina TaxID=2292771 RepID=UPI003516B5FD